MLSTMMPRSSGLTVSLIKLSRFATSFSVTVELVFGRRHERNYELPGVSLRKIGKPEPAIQEETEGEGYEEQRRHGDWDAEDAVDQQFVPFEHPIEGRIEGRVNASPQPRLRLPSNVLA